MIGIASDSVALTLAQNDAGVVSIASQTPGLVGGLTSELTGLINGGQTTSVGLSHTIASVGLVTGGIAIANKTSFTKGLPLIGEPRL